ncbi:Uma2 family endonuclease [Acaryochloris marina]|uniref:Uma2 family endonuclease n=1 Tax=Acaryochloris marina TaxID=155978 RepID=UPI001EE63D78|nr:Uma2 family endonuclease [Acaryochloris marina]
MTAITLNLESLTTLTHDQFYQLCMNNKDVVMERSRSGKSIIMLPVGGESGAKVTLIRCLLRQPDV